MDPIGYAKSHPVTTGAVVIGGVLVFVLLSGMGGGGASAAPAGKSATETAAETQITLAQISAASANNVLSAQLQQAQLAFQYSMAELSANKDVSLVKISADKEVTMMQTTASLDALKAQLSSSDNQAQINANMQKGMIDAMTGVQLAQINAQVSMNATNNSTQRKASKNNLIGSIIGAGLAIFCDENLKRNVEQVGTLQNGAGLYSFQYAWSDDWHIGPMAQEVAYYQPEAVALTESGYLGIRADARFIQ